MARKPNFTMEQQQEFINALIDEYGDTVTSKQILDLAERQGLSIPYFLLRDEKRKIGRGKYRLCTRAAYIKRNAVEETPAPVAAIEESPAMVAQVINLASRRAMNVTESFIPARLDTYVPFGFYSDLKNIINSKVFYPLYITGLSGNGKTLMIEQVCASLGRELIRVNITKRTDETDLIGSYELIDGNTVRREGPVITAMRRGAILLLDETDLGTEDLLCLQPILEGNPYFDKKTGEVIHPEYGFNIIATANTKGKGSDDGRFIGTNVLNEAFLERFAVTVEQEYPSTKVERKILEKMFKSLNIEDDAFIGCLVTWADVIRKSFFEQAVDELISTRRLVHIAKAYSIFKDRMKSIELCLNRFDTETKTAFLDLYTKVDADVRKASETDLPTDTEFLALAEDLTEKFKSEVRIYRDEAHPGAVVIASHGRTTAISEQQLRDMAITSDRKLVVDKTVEKHEFLAT